jgi:hypothetical protein
LALSLRDIRNNQEKGLYLVPLKVLAGNPSSVAEAIDFGASFSVAAVRVGDEGTAEIVKLLPELGCREAERALSLHLSENRQHVDAPRADLGLLATGLWLPTYSYARLSGLSGYLPSKLLIVPRLSKLLVAPSVSMRQLEGWLPITTFSIPAMSTGLDDLTEHVVADFKWETSTVRLRGLEGELREYYLSLFLDLVMADVVMNHSHGFPEKPVSLTFGYSLRSAEKQVKDYQESLCRVIDRCAAGFELALNDDVGIYDESRAARVPTECFGEVAVVADLGGCTLDLSIAAQGRPGLQFAEVADCACLGSNLLLRQIAENPRGYLPADGGWDFTDPQVTETQLRAWIHSGGASRLFGLDSGGRPECRELNLRGFGHAYEAGRARVLLDRYFRLIVEYMARNLVAYLIGHWYPHLPLDDHGRLRISVHLRGNGWRLRYQNESCVVATDAIRDLVRERSKALWGFVPENRYPFPENERHWVPARGYNVSDLKAETVKGMVGQAMPWSEVARNWYSHALVDLEMMNDVDFAEAYWFHKVPLRNLGTNHVEVREISPPLVLTGPSAEKQVEIRELEASLTRGLNLELHTWGVRVPVTPVIWEAVFRSRSFWPDSK